MDWDNLRFVLAASRHRSLSGAAADLGVRHTTVGRRLHALEDALSVRLFDRRPDGLHATAAGLEMVAVAERVEFELHAAQSLVMGQDTDLRGSLRVSLFDDLFRVVADGIGSFITRYPGIQLTVTSTLDPVSLTRREADVAIRLSESPPEGLLGRRVGSVHYAVYGSDALIAQVGEDAPLQDFPWLGWDERLPGKWLDTWLNDNAPGAKIVARIDESAILRKQAIAAGIGLFFMPCYEGDATPGVRQMRPPQFSRPLWMLTLMELRHTSRVRAFMDHMVDVLTDPEGPLAENA